MVFVLPQVYISQPEVSKNKITPQLAQRPHVFSCLASTESERQPFFTYLFFHIKQSNCINKKLENNPNVVIMRILFIFTGVWLLYNVILVSAIQHSESAICIRISPLYGFLSRLGNHRALSRILCAIQQILISYLLYIWW